MRESKCVHIWSRGATRRAHMSNGAAHTRNHTRIARTHSVSFETVSSGDTITRSRPCTKFSKKPALAPVPAKAAAPNPETGAAPPPNAAAVATAAAFAPAAAAAAAAPSRFARDVPNPSEKSCESRPPPPSDAAARPLPSPPPSPAGAYAYAITQVAAPHVTGIGDCIFVFDFVRVPPHLHGTRLHRVV